MDISEELFSLHGHWINCSDIFELTKHQYDFGKLQLEKEASELVSLLQCFYRLTIAYGLLYVVIEGYRKLGLKDADIDKLLEKAEYVDKLRLLRNAVFHYQKERLPDKFWGFIFISDSEKWVKSLNNAFNRYFTGILPIKEVIESFKKPN